jgi:hypothetical protein
MTTETTPQDNDTPKTANTSAEKREPWTPAQFVRDAKERLDFIDHEIKALQANRTSINASIREWREERAGVERFLKAAEGRKRKT